MVDGTISVKEGHDISHDLKDTLREKLIELGHVLIHIEPNFESIER
jgi:divalent metal cation (Fe/Co/Zn/Cd) transporter